MAQMRNPRPAQPPFTPVVHDEAGDGRQPNRKVIPRPAPMYVDSSGAATKALPSQSRALVPAGPVTGTSVVPVQQPTPQAAPQAAAQPGRADFYTNSRGETGRGAAPSSSRAVGPAGTATSPAPAEPLRLAGPKPEPVVREPNYRARAETMARAKADTAAWQADQAKQDARFAQAAQESPGRPSPRGSLRSRLPKGNAGSAAATGILVGAGEAMNVYDVAQDPNSNGADVATQAAEGVGRTAATIAGVELGAAGGAALGALGGPLAPITVPVGAVLGGVAGGATAYWGADKAIKKGRELVGADSESPLDRLPQEPAPPASEVAPAAPANRPAKVEQAPLQTDQQAPQASDPQGNGYVRTNIGVDAQGGEIVARLGDDGVPEFTNDAKAQQGAVAGRLPVKQPMRPSRPLTVPAGATEDQAFAAQGSVANLGDGEGTFSQGEEGDAALALQRFERANEIRASMKPARQLGDNGGKLTVVRDSSRMPSLAELANERREQAASQEARLDQQTANDSRRLDNDEQTAALSRKEIASRLQANELALQKGQIDLASAQRLQDLYATYEQAAPEARAAIAEQIRVLTGKDMPDRYMVVPGGQEYDPQAQAVVNRPSYVLNKQTGEIGGQSAKPARASVSRAEIEREAKMYGITPERVEQILAEKGVRVSG